VSGTASSKNAPAARHPVLANPVDTGLVVIDVQERFARAIPGFDRIVRTIAALIRGFGQYSLPIVVTEQYPRGLGHTVPRIAECLQAPERVEKITFSAMQEPRFADRVEALGAGSFVVCGIEAHVCVHQTVCDMLHAGYRIWVPWDAVGSRDPRNRILAMGRMAQAGAIPTSAEMLLFEMAGRAGTDSFKNIQSWLR